jgi:hypothetical protein
MSLLNKASLIQIPSGYKDGTLYSAKPINGDGDFTFSRGSNLAATRVNSEGLIEKGRENRLLQSNNFNTSPYSPAFATLTSGFEGYDGSNDGWKVASTTIGSETRIRQSQTFTTGEVITLSVYMKKGNVNFGIVRNYAITGGGRAWFDLENGTVATENSGINGSIEDVGNGWYRCSIWGVINQSGAVDISPAPSDGDYLADAVGEFIYVQDSQLENGLVATDYIETTTTTAQAGILEDMPRLDYSGGATCGSLILEPQRANKIPNSEYLNAVTKSNVTINTNSDISPEGVQNAHNVIANATNSDHLFFQSSMGGSTNANTQTIYAKANGYDWIHIRFDIPTKRAFFNVANGTLGTADSGITHTIEDVGNGWYRCSATMTTTNYANAVLALASADNTTNFLGDGTSGVLMYGWQSEEASYATSYIPTYGSSVTRSADSCSKTGISSLIGQTEGTLFAEIDLNLAGSNVGFYALQVYDSASSPTFSKAAYIELYQGKVYGYVRNTTIQCEIISSTYADNTRLKIAIAYKANDFALYVNGVQIGTDTSGSLPSVLNSLALHYSASSQQASPLYQAILFPTRLTNDELASLTTL